MSYASIGGLGNVVIDAAVDLRDQARVKAEVAGIPNSVFDACDHLTVGMVNALHDPSISPQTLFLHDALSFAQETGAPALSSYTGVPEGNIDTLIGVAQGKKVTLGEACSVAGAVVGLAYCGPPCAAIGAVVGTAVGAIISDVADAISSLFGSSNDERRKNEDAIRLEIKTIQDSLYDFTVENMAGCMFAVAQVYNQILQLGIPVPDTGAIVHAALAPYSGDRPSYKKQHQGKQPEQVEVLAARVDFNGKVGTLVNNSFGGMWDAGMLESGWTVNVLQWRYGGAVPTADYKNTNDPYKSIWCTWQDVDPSCVDTGAPLGATVSADVTASPVAYKQTPEQLAAIKAANVARCNGVAMKLLLWKCHNSTDDGRYRQYFYDTTQFFATNWVRIAGRDSALWQLRVQTAQQNAKTQAALLGFAKSVSGQVATNQAAAMSAFSAAVQEQVRVNLVQQQQALRVQIDSSQKALLGTNHVGAWSVGLLGAAAVAGVALWLWLSPKPSTVSAPSTG